MKHYQNNILKRLAFRLHRKFHMLIYGKLPNHNPEYYDAYVAYFDRRFDDIEKSIKHIENGLNYYIKNEPETETQTTPKKKG